MATELENRFFINGEECKYAVDTSAEAESTAFITSGGVYDLFQPLQTYEGRTIVNESSYFLQDSRNIPTVGLMWQIINKLKSDNNLR